MARRKSEAERPEKAPVVKDAASMTWRNILFGGGVFDTSREHPNKKGWEIYELGQKSFWAVPTAVDWDEPVREDPEYAEHIAAMLTFLCPGEKAAVTGASYVSNLIGMIHKFTDANGNLEVGRFVHVCEQAIRSPRALREIFAAA